MQITLETKKVDIAAVVPLRMRDMRMLAERGVDLAKASNWTHDQLVTFVHYVLAKADSSITREQAEEVPMPDLPKLIEAAVGAKARPLADRT